MHRTQIMIEDEQYVLLREQAMREGKSIGSLIRGFVAHGINSSKRRRDGVSLRSLKGVFSELGLRGSDHDRHLYGEER